MILFIVWCQIDCDLFKLRGGGIFVGKLKSLIRNDLVLPWLLYTDHGREDVGRLRHSSKGEVLGTLVAVIRSSLVE